MKIKNKHSKNIIEFYYILNSLSDRIAQYKIDNGDENAKASFYSPSAGMDYLQIREWIEDMYKEVKSLDAMYLEDVLVDIQPLEAEGFPDATEEEIMKLNFLRLTATELQFDHYIEQLKIKYNVL